jgi:hypothetical protein
MADNEHFTQTAERIYDQPSRDQSGAVTPFVIHPSAAVTPTSTAKPFPTAATKSDAGPGPRQRPSAAPTPASVEQIVPIVALSLGF